MCTAPGSGRRSPTWSSLRKAPLPTSAKNIRPVLWVPAGCQALAAQSVVGGHSSLPEVGAKDSSTQFTTLPALLKMAEWKKSTAPGCCRCRRS